MSDQPQRRPADTEPPSDPAAQRRADVRKALERHAKKLARKLDALRGDLDEAERALEWRLFGEALLTYPHLVPARGPISWRRMVSNQVSLVPQELYGKLGSYFGDRGALMQRIEKQDIEQLKQRESKAH